MSLVLAIRTDTVASQPPRNDVSFHGSRISQSITLEGAPVTSSSGTASGTSSAPASLEVHRRHERLRAEQLVARVRVGDGALVAKVTDISVGGLMLATTRSLPKGAFVEMTLLRPGFQDIAATGVVVAEPPERGGLPIRFVSMVGAAEQHLRMLVASLASSPEASRGSSEQQSTRPTEKTRLIAIADLHRRDDELESLRAQVSILRVDNDRLRGEAAVNVAAERLVGKLRLEIEGLQARLGDRGDPTVPEQTLAELRRDAEVAWMALARMTDALEKV